MNCQWALVPYKLRIHPYINITIGRTYCTAFTNLISITKDDKTYILCCKHSNELNEIEFEYIRGNQR